MFMDTEFDTNVSLTLEIHLGALWRSATLKSKTVDDRAPVKSSGALEKLSGVPHGAVVGRIDRETAIVAPTGDFRNTRAVGFQAVWVTLAVR